MLACLSELVSIQAASCFGAVFSGARAQCDPSAVALDGCTAQALQTRCNILLRPAREEPSISRRAQSRREPGAGHVVSSIASTHRRRSRSVTLHRGDKQHAAVHSQKSAARAGRPPQQPCEHDTRRRSPRQPDERERAAVAPEAAVARRRPRGNQTSGKRHRRDVPRRSTARSSTSRPAPTPSSFCRTRPREGTRTNLYT